MPVRIGRGEEVVNDHDGVENDHEEEKGHEGVENDHGHVKVDGGLKVVVYGCVVESWIHGKNCLGKALTLETRFCKKL